MLAKSDLPRGHRTGGKRPLILSISLLLSQTWMTSGSVSFQVFPWDTIQWVLVRQVPFLVADMARKLSQSPPEDNGFSWSFAFELVTQRWEILYSITDSLSSPGHADVAVTLRVMCGVLMTESYTRRKASPSCKSHNASLAINSSDFPERGCLKLNHCQTVQNPKRRMVRS